MRHCSRSLLAALMAVIFVASSFTAYSQISCGPAPKADKQRRKAAEGFPPLPLPATPLRRTEKKRPPAPPTLMAKVNYAKDKTWAQDGSQTWNWTTAAGDTQELFRFARATLGINYKADVLRLDQFSWSPERVPIMYFDGREPIALSPDERERLRSYIQSGGFILGDANCGFEPFMRTFRVEMQNLFLDRPWHRLPGDHPIFHSHFNIDKVSANVEGKQTDGLAVLEGMNIGFRTAIVFSPFGLSCGWDGHTHDYGKLLLPPDAQRLGANMLAYALAYYRVGRSQSVTTVFSEPDPGSEEIAIAQLRHNGDWDPDPSGLSYLLKAVGEQTTGEVKFRRVPLDPEDQSLFSYPFVYLTGQLDFSFTKQARENLRAYLERGGFLMVVNASHRIDFDKAARRELNAIFPERRLETLPDDHPLFSAHNKVSSKPVLADEGSLKPQFPIRAEGIDMDGRLAAVYLPIALGAAWQDAELPFVPTPDHRYALDLGVNTVVYAMTH